SLFVHLNNELERCRTLGIPLTVVVCDLDGFKQVNDKYGHLEGNRVLQAIGQGLKSVCRESDYVARMGGDEFVIVLPGLQAEDLSTKIERLCRMVATVGCTIC